MLKMVKNFVLKIQNSDESAKKVWLVVLSGLSMVVVVALWLTYMKLTVATVTPPSDVVAVENAENNTTGFFAIFSAGAKIIYDKVAALINAKISTQNNIVIENSEQNFVLEGLAPISPTKLH